MNRNPVELLAPRVMVAGVEVVPMNSEQVIAHMGVSPAMSAAYDVLADYLDHPPPMKWVVLCTTAERGGHDPEKLARKIIELNRALREA